MSEIPAFETTLEKTNLWIQEVMRELDSDDRHYAYLALRSVLHALRDRLQADEAVNLGAQLPMLIRGFYYEGWKPSRTPKKERHLAEFLEHIRDDLSRVTREADSERLARAVFAVLDRRVSQGEIEDIKGMIPDELRALWP
jgi:uncharacterized protein (DUF2267 family)